MSFLDATTAPLTAVLRQVATDIAQAQKALDDLARSQAPDPDLIDPALAPIAFHFPEVELDLSLAFSVTQFEGRNTLAVAPANPIANGFFQSASFSSRLRAKIAPRAAVLSTVLSTVLSPVLPPVLDPSISPSSPDLPPGS